MCGIAGLIDISNEPVPPVVLKRMTDEIAHRGPDGEGQWIEGNVGIGHRRLAIIDLSPAGHQPMICASNRFVLSYNGELYNYKELRIALEAEGVWFRSQTDSEVVLYALIQWGTDALLRFNGMFAFALWDRQEKSLMLGRDRYGIKPLYYALQGNRFSFGSEQKAIVVQRDFKRKLNKAAVLEYFTFQNIFTDQTLIEDIFLLPPGCYLKLGINGESKPAITQGRYWDYQFYESDKSIDRQTYVEEADRLFKQAVNRQLVSDVELGSYLSGGMDSGSITAIASQHFPYMKTFTCGFDLSSASGIELGFDERTVAEMMSYLFKTEHYEMVLKAGDMERVLPKLAWHLEEPRVGQSYPNYYAAKIASKFVKVVLSGSGGDELFGGYPWRYYKVVHSTDFENYIDNYYLYWQRLVSNSDLKKIFKPIYADVKDVCTREIFRGIFLNHAQDLSSPEDYINHSLYFESKTFLHGLLVVEDKLSMAHGMESRVPFLDNDLVDFAMSCPVSLKLNNLSQVVRVNENEQAKYFQRTNDGKQILRELMSRYIPESVTKAAKKGFSSPDASWFKGDSIDFVRRKILNDSACIYDIFDYEAVKDLVYQHINGHENRRLLIWSLLNFEEYLASQQLEI